MHASLFTDLDGHPVNLAEHAGKPIVIELWATWCGPCRKQREAVHRIAKDFPDVVFIAASADEGGAPAVKSFLAKNPTESDPASPIRDLMSTPAFRTQIAKVRSANTVPQTIYVTRRGEIADVALGQQDERFMRAMIKNLSKVKSAPDASPAPPQAAPRSPEPRTSPPAAPPSQPQPPATGRPADPPSAKPSEPGAPVAATARAATPSVLPASASRF